MICPNNAAWQRGSAGDSCASPAALQAHIVALEHAILHTRLCFSPGPGDPHSCARTLPGSTDRASRSSIAHPSWPSDQSANLYFWLTQSGPRFRRKPTFLDAGRGRHLRRHWRPSSKLPVYLVHVIPRFCCRAALPIEHPSPSSPFFETVPQTPGGGKKGKRSRGVVHPSYNARHTTGLATDRLLHQNNLTCSKCRLPRVPAVLSFFFDVLGRSLTCRTALLLRSPPSHSGLSEIYSFLASFSSVHPLKICDSDLLLFLSALAWGHGSPYPPRVTLNTGSVLYNPQKRVRSWYGIANHGPTAAAAQRLWVRCLHQCNRVVALVAGRYRRRCPDMGQDIRTERALVGRLYRGGSMGEHDPVGCHGHDGRAHSIVR